MSTTVLPRRARLLTSSAAVALFALTGCGGGDETVSSDVTAKEGLADFTGGTLYSAITYARENDLSYTVENSSGKSVEVEDTREYTVVEQDPASGTEIRPRDSLTLVVEAAE